MKTRMILAALLLLAFGSLKAQDTIVVVKKTDTLRVVTPDMSELPMLMQELGVYFQHLSDSVHWKTFEQDMEKWGEEMEEWGRKMERWGGQYEGRYKGRNTLDQVSAIQVEGSGNVGIRQSFDQFSVQRGDRSGSHHFISNGTLMLRGSSNYEVVVPQLEGVYMSSSGDVVGRGVVKGRSLHIVVTGSGDLNLDVDYDTIRVEMLGSGDVRLKGRCKRISGTLFGSGDLIIPMLQYEESQINAAGSGEVVTNGMRSVVQQKNTEEKSPEEGKRPEKKNHLLDAHWNGFEAGLNLLFKAPHEMDIRPMRCWYFGFNIADVGVAFDKRHIAGLFTGIAIGWHNYSWNNPITVEYDAVDRVYVVDPIITDQAVKNTKYGVLYAQVPLMFEFRPTRHMYIDAGVTGGLRIAQWNRVKLEDKTQTKRFFGADINRFKLDASLRVGGENLGFFANYALLPLFTMGNTEVHPMSFGLSVNF